MNKESPVIKTFTHKNKYYLYDFGKNTILQLSEELFKEIKSIQKIGVDKYISENSFSDHFNDIITLINRGYFKPVTVECVSHYLNSYLEVLENRFVQDLILQVTQDCNFQCRYCLFANDTKVERTHQKINMDYITAQKSVDYLYNHCADANDIIIGFYGGEPLLNFDLIKRITEYANYKFQSKRVRFIITTNASLLNEEIIKFLIKNSFEITISLDGNSDYQNSHRKFKANGKNTFDVVMNNIIKIKTENPLFFRENVAFNPVIFNDESEEDVWDFFESIGVHKDNININKANLNGIDYLDSPTMLFSNENIDNVRNEMKYNIFQKKMKENSMIPSHWHPNGQCVPGVRRMFVAVDGSIYPCEKIVENKVFCLGNINNSNDKIIDENQVVKILNSAKITQKECQKCWAFRFCEMCVSHCLNPSTGCLSKETKLLHCSNQKKQIMEMMKSYIDKIMCQ